jgi:hypothetical protein
LQKLKLFHKKLWGLGLSGIDHYLGPRGRAGPDRIGAFMNIFTTVYMLDTAENFLGASLVMTLRKNQPAN